MISINNFPTQDITFINYPITEEEFSNIQFLVSLCVTLMHETRLWYIKKQTFIYILIPFHNFDYFYQIPS